MVVIGVFFFLGFLLGRIIIQHCVSHRMSMAKSWGRGCKKPSKGWVWFSLYISKSQESLDSEMVVMYAPIWSTMLNLESCNCMVGLGVVVVNSLSELHSLVDRVRLGLSIGGG